MTTTSHASRRLIANASLLLVTLVWGATFALTKSALGAIPVFPYLSARFILASALLIAMSLTSSKTRTSFSLPALGLGTVLGLCLYGTYAFQTVGMTHTTASMAGFLTGLSVVLVPVFSIPLLRQKPDARTWAGVCTAVVGLALLCGVSLLHVAIGDILLIICTVFIALQVLFIEKYGRKMDALALATVEISILAICCLGTTVMTGTGGVTMKAWFQPNVVWSILICAVPGTAIAYWAQNVFQKFTSSAETAIIFSMEPVFAAVIAWLVLGDTLSAVESVGALLIFLSMLIADPSVRWGNALQFKRT